jgi:hypothetical protein
VLSRSSSLSHSSPQAVSRIGLAGLDSTGLLGRVIVAIGNIFQVRYPASLAAWLMWRCSGRSHLTTLVFNRQQARSEGPLPCLVNTCVAGQDKWNLRLGADLCAGSRLGHDLEPVRPVQLGGAHQQGHDRPPGACRTKTLLEYPRNWTSHLLR